MVSKQLLEDHYLRQGQSMQQIADQLDCSLHTIAYWMAKHGISRRSISDAVYQRHNPTGDPFQVKTPATLSDAELYGMGVGLYWGEGTKADKASVRLGNSDPKLIEVFIEFLDRFFAVRRADLRFGLQIFHDQDPKQSIRFWTERLAISPEQLYKPTITISVGKGIYRNKSKYGVLTVYFHNTKLRDIIVGLLPT